MADEKIAIDLLARARKRAVATILGYIEREVYPYLPTPAARSELRQKVITALDSNHESARDLILVYADRDDIVVNEQAMILLQEIHARTTLP